MNTKEWIIKTATKKEKITLFIWSVFYSRKMKLFLKNLGLGMNVRAAINDIKNYGK